MSFLLNPARDQRLPDIRVNHIEAEKSGDRSPFVELLDYDGETVPNVLRQAR